MREVWVRNRSDGVTELSPPLVPLDRFERVLVIGTVMMFAGLFFLAGLLPAPVLATLLAACLAGEVVLAAKALVLALLRPAAEVHEVPRWRRRRR